MDIYQANGIRNDGDLKTVWVTHISVYKRQRGASVFQGYNNQLKEHFEP